LIDSTPCYGARALRSRLPPHPGSVRIGFALVLVALFGVVWAYLDLGALERWFSALGWWGPVVFVVTFVLVTPALVPDTPLAALAGALFGVLWGTVLTTTAAVLAATLVFVLSRWLLRDWLQRVLADHPRLGAVQRVVARGRKRLLILLRVVPINPALVNYLLGATTIDFGRYLLSCVGLVPAYFATAYLGWLARFGGNATSAAGFADRVATAGFVLTIVALFFALRAARRALHDLETRPRNNPGE
jgi:uncharacterized membrane protein YdjX (TVP38/TMEM64 family)